MFTHTCGFVGHKADGDFGVSCAVLRAEQHGKHAAPRPQVHYVRGSLFAWQ